MKTGQNLSRCKKYVEPVNQMHVAEMYAQCLWFYCLFASIYDQRQESTSNRINHSEWLYVLFIIVRI